MADNNEELLPPAAPLEISSSPPVLFPVDSLGSYTTALSTLSVPGSLAEDSSNGAFGQSSGGTVRLKGDDLRALTSFPPKFPSHKRIPGTKFVVDGFRSAGSWSRSYFLTHFHSDHYQGITPQWSKGLIFCSEITARLVLQVLQVPAALVVVLPLEHPVEIDGCTVTLVDANHCPGAVQFLFEVPSNEGTKKYVHCGDMRYCTAMKENVHLQRFCGADAVFLDTTYCNPRHIFPSQEESVDYVANTIKTYMDQGRSKAADAKPSLILIATYVIGKEKILTAVAGRCKQKIYVEERKIRLLECLELGDLTCFTTDATETNIQVVGWNILGETWPYFRPNWKNMEEMLANRGGHEVIGFVPTGWTYETKKKGFPVRSKGACKIHLVPYSEHSNYDELREYIGFLRPKEIIPTVGLEGGDMGSKAVAGMRKHFRHLVDESSNKRRFLKGFLKNEVSENPPNDKLGVLATVGASLLETYETSALEDTAFEDVKGLTDGDDSPAKVKQEQLSVPVKAGAESALHERKRSHALASTSYQEVPRQRRRAAVTAAMAITADATKYFSDSQEMELPDSQDKDQQKPKEKPTEDTDWFEGEELSRQEDEEWQSDTEVAKKPRRSPVKAGPLKVLDKEEQLERMKKAVEFWQVLGKKPEAGTIQAKSSEKGDTNGDTATEKGDTNGVEHVKRENLCEEGDTVAEVRVPRPDPGPSEVLLEVGQKVEVKSEAPGGEKLSPEVALSQLQSILPSSVGRKDAEKLLALAGGDTAAAATWFFDGGLVPTEGLVSPPGTESGGKRSADAQPKMHAEETLKVVSPSGRTPRIVSPSSRQTKAGGKRKNGKALPQQPSIRSFFASKSNEVKPAESDRKQAEQLVNLIGPGLSQDEAYALLEKTGGDISKALDVHFEQQQSAGAESAPRAAFAYGEEDEDLSEALVRKKLKTDPNDLKTVTHSDTRRGTSNKGAPEALMLSRMEVSKDMASAVDQSLAYPSKMDAEEMKEESDMRDSGTPGKEQLPPTKEQSTPGKEVATPGKEQVTPGKEQTTPGKEAATPGKEQATPGKGAIKQGPADVDRAAVALPVAKYNAVEHACWRAGEAAPYLHLSRTFEILEKERGRLKMADILCNMFRSLLALSSEDVLPAVYMATNRVAPDYEGVDMNIGGSTVAAAVSEATGVPRGRLREMHNLMGDLGDVAQACKQKQTTLMVPSPLRVRQVYAALRKIAKESGPGSTARRKNIVLGLLRACRERETLFVVRTLIMNMRIGAMTKTVLPALAQAVVVHKALDCNLPPGPNLAPLKPKMQEAGAAITEAYNFCPNLDILVPALVEGGVEAVLARGTVALGTPVKPMLAKITNGIPEVLKRFQGHAFTAEFKYDGQRAQIHLLEDGSVKIFSRNCDDTTARFPDVFELVKSAAQGGATTFIIDAELVAVDRRQGNRLMAFQHLSTRARGGEKTKVELSDIKVAVCVFAFDLLYLDGRPLVKLPLRERRRLLREAFPAAHPGYFEFARDITVAAVETEETAAQLHAFLQEALSSSCEGLMAKSLDHDAGYAASKRSDSWLKVKKDYVEGMHDSLDLVPIGAWFGQGRKAGWFSPFLLACYDPDREEYQSVCRVMSGFTDAFYKETSALYKKERLLETKPAYFRTLEQPDVWFRPSDVWEIRGADLTVSPVHQAAVGLVHPSRGISMRFPRMIRVREDKKVEDASGPVEIADLFNKQTRKLDIAGTGGPKPKTVALVSAEPDDHEGGATDEEGSEGDEDH